jgi:outer membrane protein TolC
VQSQYKAGAVSGLDLTQAEQSVQSQKASLSQIEQQRVEARTAIAVLLHEPVQQLNIQEPTQLPRNALPNIAVGLLRIFYRVVQTYKLLNYAYAKP